MFRAANTAMQFVTVLHSHRFTAPMRVANGPEGDRVRTFDSNALDLPASRPSTVRLPRRDPATEPIEASDVQD